MTNNDAAACAPATYVASATLPASWQFSSATIALAPGSSTSRTMTVTSYSGAAEGLYSWPVKVTNAADSTKAASSTAGAMLVRSLTVVVSLDRPTSTTNQTVTATALISGAGAPLSAFPWRWS